jgi:hypothetical protein
MTGFPATGNFLEPAFNAWRAVPVSLSLVLLTTRARAATNLRHMQSIPRLQEEILSQTKSADVVPIVLNLDQLC